MATSGSGTGLTKCNLLEDLLRKFNQIREIILAEEINMEKDVKTFFIYFSMKTDDFSKDFSILSLLFFF